MHLAAAFRLRSIPILAAAAFACDGARCQTPEAPPQPAAPALTLAEAVRMALAGNLGLAVQRFDHDSAQESVAIAEADFDPALGLEARRSSTKAPGANTLDASTSSDAGTTLSASKRFDTGATASVTTLLSRSDNNRTGNRFDPTWTSDLSVSVRQPLLQGAGTAVNRAARRRARLGVEGSDLTFAAVAMDVVRDTEIAFYDLAGARHELEVQRNGLAAAEAFLRENEARLAAGLATELDVMQARVGAANRRAQIVTADQRLRDAADALLSLLGHDDFAGVPAPQGIVFEAEPPAGIEASYAKALANDPGLRLLQTRIAQAELDVLVAANQRRPRVDLGGTVGTTGVDDSLSGANSQLATGGFHDWRLDLSVSMPWGMREGRARHRLAEISLEQQRARLRQLHQDVLVRIRAAVRAVESGLLSVEACSVAAELSRRQLELEKAKYEAGSSTSRFVVDAQQAADEALVRRTRAQIQSQQDRARLRRIEGGSLAAYGIQLPAPRNP